MKNKKKSYFKKAAIIVASFFAVFLTGLSFLTSQAPVSYAAGTISNQIGNFNGSGSWSDSGNWTYSNGTLNGSITASSSTSCGKTTYTAQETTFTLSNNASGATEGNLSFSYTLTLNSGSCKINGTAKTASGSYSGQLAAGGSITIYLKSSATANPASISITNIELSQEHDIVVTLKMPNDSSAGSYTYKIGTANAVNVTSETTVTIKSTQSIVFTANPASGKKLYYWLFNNTSKESYYTKSITVLKTDSYSISPFFTENLPEWKVGSMTSSTVYSSLSQAITAVSSASTKKIFLYRDGELRTGNYTIPSGVSLIIPCDSSGSAYTDSSIPCDNSARIAPTPYLSLTMKSGANITLSNNSYLYVPSSRMSAVGQNSGSWNGTPCGPYGLINMESGSTITANSGSTIYCFGFIAGEGHVDMKSGSTIWEMFQLRCWRGGTCATKSVWDNNRIFQMSQYYVQNVEAYLTIEKGATEKVRTAVNASSSAYTASTEFIGSAGMFRITKGSITKKFDGPTDRLILTVNDDSEVSISELKLSISLGFLIGTVSLNTSNFVLPINSNITISVNSGSLINVASGQDMALLPGSKLLIEEGADITIDSKVYVYDKSEWANYAISDNQLSVVGYSVANGSTTKRTAASLTDAEIDINGLLTINKTGALYTTNSGANIHSSTKSGVINYVSAAGTETATYQCTVSGSDPTLVPIPITSAKLRNDNSTTATRAARNDAGNTVDADGNETNVIEDIAWEVGVEYVSTTGVPANYHFQIKNERYELTNDETYNDKKYSCWMTLSGVALKNTIEYYSDDTYETRLFATSYVYDATNPLVYTFKTGAELGLTKTVIGWYGTDNKMYIPGQGYALEYVSKIKFYPQYAGWVKSSTDYYFYFTATEYATGLYRLGFDEGKVINNQTINDGEICYFSSTGLFMQSFSGVFKYDTNEFAKGDNNYYFISSGIVDSTQGVKSAFDSSYSVFRYYYVDSDGFVAINKRVYVSSTHAHTNVPEGWYMTNSLGELQIHGVPTSITSDIAKDENDLTCYNYGLFELSGHLYYALYDGSIAKNTSVYITKTNGYSYQFSGEDRVTITAGLYFFDSEGRMYSSDFRLINAGVSNNA